MMKYLLMASILTFLSVVTCAAQTQQALDKDQITEVTLERTACYGTCPIYKVTLSSDGTIIYEGERFVQMMGTYKGTAYGFDRLAKLILAENYFNLKDEYTRPITDMPSAVTSVVRGGKRKTIVDYAGTGPVELWGIEMVIDGMLKNARLDKVEAQPVRPPRK
ncbi:MAG TPA: DUF6438 domain-containing protein [Pyrinomonadaceae bacterium]